MMKVLVVCQHYWPEPFNVTDICEGLAERGHAVTILTGLPNTPEGDLHPAYRKGLQRRQVHHNVSIIRSPIVTRGTNLRGINKVRRVINYLSFDLTASITSMNLGESFDCVFIVQYSPVIMAMPGLRYARRHNVPSLLYCFDLWPEDLLTGGMSKNGIPYHAMRTISRRVYSLADKIAVTSPDFEGYFDSVLGLGLKSFFYLPQYAEAIFEALGEREHDEGHPLHLLFAGNIAANQSVQTIIKAASLLEEGLPVVIDIVGSGSQLDDCLQAAQDLRVTNVFFHGRKSIDEVVKYYDKADGAILTLSNAENGSLVPSYTIPRKLQSYLAAGKPVIASAPGVTARIVNDSGSGIAVAPGKEVELAHAITAFASMTSEERTQIGKNARAYYLENYSRSRFFDDLDSLLTGLTV